MKYFPLVNRKPFFIDGVLAVFSTVDQLRSTMDEYMKLNGNSWPYDIAQVISDSFLQETPVIIDPIVRNGHLFHILTREEQAERGFWSTQEARFTVEDIECLKGIGVE